MKTRKNIWRITPQNVRTAGFARLIEAVSAPYNTLRSFNNRFVSGLYSGVEPSMTSTPFGDAGLSDRNDASLAFTFLLGGLAGVASTDSIAAGLVSSAGPAPFVFGLRELPATTGPPGSGAPVSRST